jgi:hypothetical protein
LPGDHPAAASGPPECRGEGEVVGGAEGQDADRLAGLDGRHRPVHRAVAAGHDDRVDILAQSG